MGLATYVPAQYADGKVGRPPGMRDRPASLCLPAVAGAPFPSQPSTPRSPTCGPGVPLAAGHVVWPQLGPRAQLRAAGGSQRQAGAAARPAGCAGRAAVGQQGRRRHQADAEAAPRALTLQLLPHSFPQQVIVSIQSMILVQDPYYNEPGETQLRMTEQPRPAASLPTLCVQRQPPSHMQATQCASAHAQASCSDLAFPFMPQAGRRRHRRRRAVRPPPTIPTCSATTRSPSPGCLPSR
jgi:hypothetical protein